MLDTLHCLARLSYKSQLLLRGESMKPVLLGPSDETFLYCRTSNGPNRESYIPDDGSRASVRNVVLFNQDELMSSCVCVG